VKVFLVMLIILIEAILLFAVVVAAENAYSAEVISCPG
jgi:hypothetical protein